MVVVVEHHLLSATVLGMAVAVEPRLPSFLD